MSSTYDVARGCAHHGCLPADPQSLLTLPNLITLARTLGALLLVFAAIAIIATSVLLGSLRMRWPVFLVLGSAGRFVRFGLLLWAPGALGAHGA